MSQLLPDYLGERFVLVHVFMLGMMEIRVTTESCPPVRRRHGVPPLSVAIDSEVETMAEEIRAFHAVGTPGLALEMDYIPHLCTVSSSLVPIVLLEIIRRLQLLIPQGAGPLALLKRNIAWRHIVEPMR